MTARLPIRRRGREGIALVLALVILAGLLLLGLPLLFSQSASVAGSRSYADAKIGQVASTSAQNIAIDAAARAIAPQLASPAPGGADTAPGTCLPWAFAAGRIGQTPPYPYPAIAAGTGAADLPWVPADTDGSMALNMYAPVLGWPAASPRVGISARITDEAGKLDPNAMSAVVWQQLFVALGIPDWDDGQVQLPPLWPQDGDTIGNLANALAECRTTMPGGRITQLEQLLAVQARNSQTNLRRSLTRGELERLRPYLTLWNPAPGRGLIDLGTVVASDTTAGANVPYLLLDSNPGDDQDGAGAPNPVTNAGGNLLAYETALALTARDASTGGHVRAFCNNYVAGGGGGTAVAWGRELADSPAHPLAGAVAGMALAIEAPAALNVHHLSGVVRQAISIPVNGANLDWVPRPLDATGAPARLATPGALYSTTGYAYMPDPGSSPPSYGLNVKSLFARRSPISVLSQIGGQPTSELPPLGIASPGVWSIEAASTVSDASSSANRTAQDLRRAVVQAVPQERLLEWHWSTQSEFEMLLGQRFGSHMQSWPVAWQRRTQDTTGNMVTPKDAPDAAGDTELTAVRPAPLTDIIVQPPNGTYVGNNTYPWAVAFGGGPANVNGFGPRQDAAIFNTIGNDAVVGSPLATDIRPDGYHQTGSNGVIAYTIRALNTANTPFTTGNANSTTEMDSLQVSFWFAPEGDWTGTTSYCLCEARSPDGNLSAQASDPSATGAAATIPGSGDGQNGWALYYDETNEMLVLTTATPAIEHDHDSGWQVASDNPLSPGVNESSLPVTGSATVAVLAPNSVQGPGLKGMFPAIWHANRVLHVFRTPHDVNGPHFRKHQWYHVQLALASDRPEEAHIVLDGISGQDMAKKAAADPVLLGDHCTLPSLVLGQDLPCLSATPASVADLTVGTIAVTIPGGLGLTAKDLLPARGIVRIDDEYIAYDNIDGNNLNLCVRGARQNTNTSVPGQAWPTLQSHPIGALVVPGGYRLGGLAGTWYRGGCTLVDAFGQGDTTGTDPANPNSLATIWGRLGTQGTTDSIDPRNGQATKVLAANTADISVTGTGAAAAVVQEFPPNGGVIWIHGYMLGGADQVLVYDTFDGTAFHNCRVPDGTWNSAPKPLNFAPSQQITFYPANPPLVSLVGIKVATKDPLQTGRYFQASAIGDQRELIQLLDPATGGVEWLHYDWIIDDPNGTNAYFVNNSAFYQGRGQQRTAILDNPANSRVIPVQTDLGAPGHVVATGDVLTLMPILPLTSAATARPFQVIVRYAATDGYPTLADGSDAVDTKNEYFALAAPITDDGDPAPLPAAQFQILCAPCWSGYDLTGAGGFGGNGLAPVATGLGCLPRIDLMNSALNAGSGAAWYLGGKDPGSKLAVANPDLTIDSFGASPMPNLRRQADTAPTTPCGVLRFFSAGSATECLVLGPALADMTANPYVQASLPIFTNNMGLVDIDGEVFAYQRLDPNDASTVWGVVSAQRQAAAKADLSDPYQWDGSAYPADQNGVQNNGCFAKLVARGLLDLDHDGGGSAADANCGWKHTIIPANLTADAHHRVLPAAILPLGPVWRLADGETINDGQWFGFTNAIDDSNALINQPVGNLRNIAMVCPANGIQDQSEVVQFIGPDVHSVPVGSPPCPYLNKYTTASWLHGMYNTVHQATAWSAADHPIFIGWWPRYASALPADDGQKVPTTEQFRCRANAWVGFPATIAQGYFWPQMLKNTFPAPWNAMHMAEVDGVDNAEGSFAVEARALTALEGDDWATVTWRNQPGTPVGADGDVSAAFDDNDQLRRFSTTDGHPVACSGAELRVTWHYTAKASSRLGQLAGAADLAPAIGAVRLRGLAPVTVLANELSP